MTRHALMRSISLVLCIAFLVACAHTTTSSAIDTAGRVAVAADLATAAVVKSITVGVQTGKITSATAQIYVDKIAPRVQTALDQLKALLETLKTSPGVTTTEQVTAAILAVQDAVAIAQAFGADPGAWATKEGITP